MTILLTCPNNDTLLCYSNDPLLTVYILWEINCLQRCASLVPRLFLHVLVDSDQRQWLRNIFVRFNFSHLSTSRILSLGLEQGLAHAVGRPCYQLMYWEICSLLIYKYYHSTKWYREISRVCCHVLLWVRSTSNNATGNIRVMFPCITFVTMVILILSYNHVANQMCSAKIG